MSWMGLLWKEGALDDPSAPWRFRHRFRYSTDPDPWNPDDVRNWYEVEAPGDISGEGLRSLLKGAELVAQACGLRNGTTPEVFRPEGGSGLALVEAMSSRPWFHGRPLPEVPP
jgi:hypothetical protein